MVLTKKQRIEHYKRMLTHFEKGLAIGFCTCSLSVGDIPIIYLPEIMEYEPKDHGLYWFCDCSMRPNILREIISKMESEQI